MSNKMIFLNRAFLLTGRGSRCFLLLVLMGMVLGCGGPAGPKNTVSGKVTLEGQPVAGIVVFLSGDGKEVSGPINYLDGTYQIPDPPSGQVSIVVKGLPA